MSAVQRQLQITYGTTVASGTLSSAVLSLQGVHTISKTADDFSVSYNVLVTGSTVAIFRAGCAAFETAMTTRRQDFKVETLTAAGVVDQTLLDLSHTGNTALSITAELSKPGGDTTDSNLSRLYEVTVSGELPTKSALAGLRTFDYDVVLSPSRKGTLTVRGTYTAVASVQAKAQYQASIAARVSSITTALTGTWELVDETYTPDDTDQTVSFSRTYMELIFNESASALSNAKIVDQMLTIKTDRLGSEGLRDERKLATIVATYSCSVDKGETQDLANLWVSVVRPWIVKNIRTVAATSKLAITAQSPEYDYAENRISASMTAQARTGSDTISSTVTATDDIETGLIFSKTWPTGKFKLRSWTPAYVFQGPRTYTRTITRTQTVIGKPNMPSPSSDGKGGGAGGGGGGSDRDFSDWGGFGGKPGDVRFESSGGLGIFEIGSSKPGDSILSFTGPEGGGAGGGSSGGSGEDGDFDSAGGFLIRYSQSQTPRTIGLPGEQLDLTDKSETSVYEFIAMLKSGQATGTGEGGGGGGGRRSRPR